MFNAALQMRAEKGAFAGAVPEDLRKFWNLSSSIAALFGKTRPQPLSANRGSVYSSPGVKSMSFH
jgi:hypothetical protein